jgi:CBS-domain-containing membrane protein
LHFNALDLVTDGGEIQNCAIYGQIHGTSEHDSCVPCAYIDAELAQVILMWAQLPDIVRQQMLTVLREFERRAERRSA